MLPFLIAKGLSDSSSVVSVAALTAGRDMMRQYGAVAVADLLPILEVSSII